MDDSSLRRARKGYQQALSMLMAAAARQALQGSGAALVACYALLESLQDGPNPAGSHQGLDAAVGIFTNTLTAFTVEVSPDALMLWHHIGSWMPLWACLLVTLQPF